MKLRPRDLQPLDARTQREAVAEAIRRVIFLGLVPAGERLPPERELAPTLGVSRRTLRSAIRQLADDGLVETTVGRNGGTRVRPPPPDPEKIETSLEEARHALLSSFEARLVIEPALARLAADRADPDSAAELVALADRHPDTPIEVRTVDSRFHSLVAQMAGNEFLLAAVELARTGFFEWADLLWMPFEGMSEEERTSRDQHIRIASAIRNGDGKEAATVMRRHLRWSLGTFERRMWPGGAGRTGD